MHPVERDDLKRFIQPYLSIDAGEEEWRGGYFKVKEGPAFRDSKERIASIRWQEKKSGGPRAVRSVLSDLESAIDLITAEPHERVWVVAFHTGKNNPNAWHPVAAADGMGEGHHSSEMESALTARMSRGATAGGGDITAIALARMGMAAQAQTMDITERYLQAIEQLAVTTAENRNLTMLLDGALSMSGADSRERMYDFIQTMAPHMAPTLNTVLTQAAAAMMPADIPADPGARADHHVKVIKTNMLALIALVQAEPTVMTPERHAAVGEIIAEVLKWQASKNAADS